MSYDNGSKYQTRCPRCGEISTVYYYENDTNGEPGWYMATHRSSGLPDDYGEQCFKGWGMPMPPPGEEWNLEKAIARLIALEELLQ